MTAPADLEPRFNLRRFLLSGRAGRTCWCR